MSVLNTVRLESGPQSSPGSKRLWWKQCRHAVDVALPRIVMVVGRVFRVSALNLAEL